MMGHLQSVVEAEKNGDVFRFFGLVWRFGYDVERDLFYMADNNGCLVEKLDAIDFAEALLNYVDAFPDHIIRMQNDDADERIASGLRAAMGLDNCAKNSSSKNVNDPGFVYFIIDDAGRVKIGKTKNMRERMGEYTKLPVEPEIINVIECENYTKAEKILHKIFSKYRLRGEWFRLRQKDVMRIKKLKTDIYTVDKIKDAFGGDIH